MGFRDAILLAGEEQVKEEVREAFSEKAEVMKGMMGKVAASAVGILNAEDNKHTEAHLYEWVEKLFVRADKNHDEKISFEEFRAFVREDARQIKEEHAQEVRDKVADNMAAHGG